MLHLKEKAWFENNAHDSLEMRGNNAHDSLEMRENNAHDSLEMREKMREKQSSFLLNIKPWNGNSLIWNNGTDGREKGWEPCLK